MVRLVISCLGYLVAYPKTRHVAIRSKTSTATYLCYSAFRAALGSVEPILPRLEFMCLIKKHFAVFIRTRGYPQSCFAELSMSTSAPYQTVQKFIPALTMMPNLLWGSVDFGWGVRWALCVWEHIVHPAAHTLKRTSKRH